MLYVASPCDKAFIGCFAVVMELGELDVVRGILFHEGALFGIGFTHDLARDAHDNHVVGHDKAGGNDSAGGDDTVVADFGVAEDSTVHADEATVANGFAVADGVVPDGDGFTYDVGEATVAVDCGVVLHIGVFADGDGGDIAADGGAVPDIDVFVERDFTEDAGGVSDVNIVVFLETHGEIVAWLGVSCMAAAAGCCEAVLSKHVEICLWIAVGEMGLL